MQEKIEISECNSVDSKKGKAGEKKGINMQSTPLVVSSDFSAVVAPVVLNV